MECPQCGFVREDSSAECPRCGLVFAKWKGDSSRSRSGEPGESPGGMTRPGGLAIDGPVSRTRSGPAFGTHASGYGQPRGFGPARGLYPPTFGNQEDPLVEDDEDFPPQPRHMETNDWLVLASGPVFALLIMCLPFLNHIFMTFCTLVHEMGHTFTGWIFGYPALPAFDLRYGGGVTATMPRSILLLVIFYAVMIFLLYSYRKNRTAFICLSVFLAVHILLSATMLHDVVFLMMGHGMELIIAAIFFYRALSGAAVVHAAERPLYCIISWFIVLSDLRFAYRLATSAQVRRLYEEAKGGGHWMDFSRVAEDYLHTDLKVVAAFFFVATLLPLVVGFLAFRYQEYLRRVVVHLWVRDPSQACVCEITDQGARNM